MKEHRLLPALICSIVLLLSSCTKEGPEGPAGKNGNANVKTSTLTFSNWTWDSSNSFMYANFTWSEITSSVMNSGAVYLYVNTSAGWAALPRTLYPSSTYSESQRFTY